MAICYISLLSGKTSLLKVLLGSERGEKKRVILVNSRRPLGKKDRLARYKKEFNKIVLYCIDGVVIAAQCTATFSISIVLPRILVLLGGEYDD